MQQSLPQALPFSLQQAAQLSLQHFSQALPAARAVLERAATEAAAMRVRMVFMVSDVFVLFGLNGPLGGFRRAAQAGASRVCHRVALNWR